MAPSPGVTADQAASSQAVEPEEQRKGGLLRALGAVARMPKLSTKLAVLQTAALIKAEDGSLPKALEKVSKNLSREINRKELIDAEVAVRRGALIHRDDTVGDHIF